jgi:hypothetical protein
VSRASAATAGAVLVRSREASPASGPRGATRSLAGWLAAFAGGYAVVVFAPTFLLGRLGPFLTLGDLVELVGSFVLVGLAWRLHHVSRAAPGHPVRSRLRASFGTLAVASMLYLCATGMHVAANAVTRHLVDPAGSPAWQAAHFFDEVLSHLLASAGLVTMSAALLVAAAAKPVEVHSFTVLSSAALFGFAWFVDAVEGRTVALVLPISGLAIAAILIVSRRRREGLRLNPVRLFYTLALAVALVFFLAWWAWRGGFPEFSEVGWI